MLKSPAAHTAGLFVSGDQPNKAGRALNGFVIPLSRLYPTTKEASPAPFVPIRCTDEALKEQIAGQARKPVLNLFQGDRKH